METSRTYGPQAFLLQEHDITVQCSHAVFGASSSGTKASSTTTTTTSNENTIPMRSGRYGVYMRARASSTCSAASSFSSVTTSTATTSSSRSLPTRRSTDSSSSSSNGEHRYFEEYVDHHETSEEVADERFLSANPSFVSQYFARRRVPVPEPTRTGTSPTTERWPLGRHFLKSPTRTYSTPTTPFSELVKPSYPRTQSLHEDSFVFSRRSPGRTRLLPPPPTIMVTPPSSEPSSPCCSFSAGPAAAGGRDIRTITLNRNNLMVMDPNTRSWAKRPVQIASPQPQHRADADDSDEEDNISLGELKQLLKESKRTRHQP